MYLVNKLVIFLYKKIKYKNKKIKNMGLKGERYVMFHQKTSKQTKTKQNKKICLRSLGDRAFFCVVFEE